MPVPARAVMACVFASALSLTGLAPAAAAQRRPAPLHSLPLQALAADSQPDLGGPLLGGVVGMAFGSFAGLFLAGATACDGDFYNCDEAGAILVWGGTEALFVAAVTGLAIATSSDNGAILLPLAGLQLGLTIWAERSWGTRRAGGT